MKYFTNFAIPFGDTVSVRRFKATLAQSVEQRIRNA